MEKYIRFKNNLYKIENFVNAQHYYNGSYCYVEFFTEKSKIWLKFRSEDCLDNVLDYVAEIMVSPDDHILSFENVCDHDIDYF